MNLCAVANDQKLRYLRSDSSQDGRAEFPSLLGSSEGVAGGVLQARQLGDPRRLHRHEGVGALQSRLDDLERAGDHGAGGSSNPVDRERENLLIDPNKCSGPN